MVKLRVKKESQEKKEEGNKWSQEAAVYVTTKELNNLFAKK